jgi:hypothetical protein
MGKICVMCGRSFNPRRSGSRQAICGREACKRKRKRQWQMEKRRKDRDYRDNQEWAQKRWVAKNPDYWAKYRLQHPEYVEDNKLRQRERNSRRRVVQDPQGMNHPGACDQLSASCEAGPPSSAEFQGAPMEMVCHPLLGYVQAKLNEICHHLATLSSHRAGPSTRGP